MGGDAMHRRFAFYAVVLLCGLAAGAALPGWAAGAMALLCGIALVYLILAWCLYARIRRRVLPAVQVMGERVLVIAPHQDDCVAMAGGYAIQTVKRGGEVFILYVTDGDDDKVTRQREAASAWGLLGLDKVQLAFLSHDNRTAFLQREEIDRGIQEIAGYLSRLRPDVVFVPLYEGGHYHHDVINYMTRQALGRSGIAPKVLESPIYNFYLSWRTTPEKVFAGLVRWIPGMRFVYAPEPVSDRPLYRLPMSDEELRLKKEIILQFKSQSPQQLVARWGFEDRYQDFYDYDYSQPPFDYPRSIAARVDALKSWPVLGGLARRLMVWTRTIHPDPNTRMTQIPA